MSMTLVGIALTLIGLGLGGLAYALWNLRGVDHEGH